MKHAVLDTGHVPPCVVIITDDDDECITTAQRYANQTGRQVTIASCEPRDWNTVDPESALMVGAPRVLTASDFATPADAARAGFPFLLPSSGDEGEVSGDTSEDDIRR